jgi:sugar-specific transcriptional regulator TrmB
MKVVQDYLQVLDIEPSATIIYVALLKLGPSSALELSRETKISRTQIYRYLEQLITNEIVISEQLSYGTSFQSLPLENIQSVITKHETETATMKQDLSAMSDLIKHIAGTNGPEATIQHYYGQAGLKQVMWNLVRANDELRAFETITTMSQKVDMGFLHRFQEQYKEHQLRSRILTNTTSRLDCRSLVAQQPQSQIRSVDPTVLDISFTAYTYNDIVLIIDNQQDQQVALEIRYPFVKAMMQQLFDAIWATAAPLT